ncbi:glycine--tRNA ligase [Candidatus Dependentiae bacterium]|nr:glycine--tRNA ligase [Candidatus Dependentiae bacterium]
MQGTVSLETIISLCKRRGFVFQSSEIYGGLNGVYDLGPLGTLLKQNIRRAWIHNVTDVPFDVFLMEGSLLAGAPVWQASGHLDNFHDPMVDCLNCKKRFRADDLDLERPCPSCGVRQWTAVREFNLMFKTQLGAMQDASSDAYLRPETAQAIFINFKNVLTSCRAKMPFGIGQIGKSFRNEITPKQFVFRTREFEQMELEWFCQPDRAAADFDFWLAQRYKFYQMLGLTMHRLRFRPHRPDELAHYAVSCTDVEYEFPFGWKELEGIANRGAFDLTQHSQHSGKDLSVFDESNNTKYMPHVVEASVGSDRLMLTLLFDAYREEEVDGEVRTVLQLHPALAPITAALLPLSKQHEDAAHGLYRTMKKRGYSVSYDASGSIGKRYRRQDEIGTPFCFTYDFDSAADQCVTIRHRDTMQQERVSIDAIEKYLQNAISWRS